MPRNDQTGGAPATLQIKLSRCAPNGFEEVRQLLDEEFIHARDRTISLAERYPGVYSRENARNIFMLSNRAGVASVAVAKPFAWQGREGVRRGAMIGGVCTAPEFRGRGYATALLAHLAEELALDGIEWAILWSAAPGLYERSGWSAGPEELFGELRSLAPVEYAGTVTRSGPAAVHAANIEEERQRHGAGGMIRDALSYRRLPLPTTTTFCVSAADGKRQSLALAGEHENQAIVYEMYGDTVASRAILADLLVNYSHVWIHGRGSGREPWAEAGVTDVTWQRRAACYRRVFTATRAEEIMRIEIPIWDRI